MNEKDEQKLKQVFSQAAKEVKLPDGEKARMRAFLIEYAKTRSAVRKGWIERLIIQRQELDLAHVLAFGARLGARAVPLALVIVITAGAGVSFAAEGALPGDLLYSVKVRVSEKAVGLLAFSQERKTEWEASRVERRLDEAKELIATGKLTEKNQEIIEEELAKQSGVLAAAVNKLRGSEETAAKATAEEVSSRIETTLAAHEAIITKLAIERDGEKENRLMGLAQNMRAEAKKAESARAAAEKSAVSETGEGRADAESAANEKRAAKKEIAGAETFLRSRRNALKKETLAEGKRMINRSRAIVADGEKLLADKKYGGTSAAFKEARAIARKVTLFLKAEIELKIDSAPLVTAITAAEPPQKLADAAGAATGAKPATGPKRAKPMVPPAAVKPKALPQPSVSEPEHRTATQGARPAEWELSEVKKDGQLAEDKIAEVRLLLGQKIQRGEERVAQAETRLGGAEFLHAQGRIALKNNDASYARSLFAKALAIASEAEELLRQSQNGAAEVEPPAPTATPGVKPEGGTIKPQTEQTTGVSGGNQTQKPLPIEISN